VLPADPARIATARLLLAQLGVSLADLQQDERPRVPTLAEYLPCVRAAAGPGARRTYGTYWIRMAAAWGTRPLDTIVASDIEALQHQMAATARSRRNSRGGRHAGEHVIAAARAVYNRAISDGLLDAAASPAHRVVKPRRLPSTRRALTPDELAEINLVARTSGNDVILDALLLRLHTETACRRGGALALRVADLNHRVAVRPQRCQADRLLTRAALGQKVLDVRRTPLPGKGPGRRSPCGGESAGRRRRCAGAEFAVPSRGRRGR
jgi:hypothetical protein